MADPRTNLKVSIGAELGEIKSALASLRGDLKQTQKAASGVDLKGITSGLKGFLGAVGGLGAVTLGIRAIANATIEAEKAQAQLNAVLKSTGGAAGLSAGELNKMADSLQAITTFDDEAITGAQSLLLTFTNVGRDVFPDATKAILDMSVAMGQDLKSSTVQVGKALNDPIAGITALTRVGVTFTQAQKDLIKSLVDTGKGAEAQVIILKELQREFGGSAEAARNTLGGALEGLKNDFENLLEGDSGSDGVRGATEAINQLAKQMQSSETKQGFSDIINLIAKLGQVAVITTGFLAKMFRQTSEGLAAATGGGVYAYSEATIQEKIDNFERLKADLKGATPALKAQWDKELAVLRGRLQQIKAQQIADSVNMPPEARAAAAKGNFNTSGDAEAEAKRAAAAAAAEAKRATAARIAEEKRAAEEIRKINEAEEQDRIERDKRISEGLAEVRIDLLRQSGQAAEAAFAEIDAKYAQLLADLRAKGDSEGEATLRKLIGLEKADAELKAFDEQVRAVMDNLREQTAFINNAREVPGGITSLQAEEQMRALRAQSIQQLTVLREKAMAAYNAAPTAETLARVNQLDGAIKELDDSFTTLLAKTAEDEGVQALSGFFTDLALEAKSFKDAFKDMVRNFVSGIAQMVAQQLALNAVKGITRAFGSFHTGGVAGQAGGSRRVVDPAVFAAAPRYHGGGVAGLRANEVPAILLKGERVLSPSQTREYDRGSRPSPGVRIVNVFDPNFVPDQMDSAAGEKVILNAIARNPGRINQMLG